MNDNEYSALSMTYNFLLKRYKVVQKAYKNALVTQNMGLSVQLNEIMSSISVSLEVLENYINYKDSY